MAPSGPTCRPEGSHPGAGTSRSARGFGQSPASPSRCRRSGRESCRAPRSLRAAILSKLRTAPYRPSTDATVHSCLSPTEHRTARPRSDRRFRRAFNVRNRGHFTPNDASVPPQMSRFRDKAPAANTRATLRLATPPQATEPKVPARIGTPPPATVPKGKSERFAQLAADRRCSACGGVGAPRPKQAQVNSSTIRPVPTKSAQDAAAT